MCLKGGADQWYVLIGSLHRDSFGYRAHCSHCYGQFDWDTA
jgi:hypothetical protein